VIVAMQGLAVMHIVKRDDAFTERVLRLLKELCRETLNRGTEA
jgi:hypothetical protein